MLDSEPDAVVFPRLSRRSLRRAMMTPGVREFDAATIMWRSEQGDLARDFRQAALRRLFDACLARTVAHEEEPVPANAVDEIIHPWLIRLCSVFLDQGMAYWSMPHREQGFYASVRTLLSQPWRHVPPISDGFGRRVSPARAFRLLGRRMRFWTTSMLELFHESDWENVLRSELLALPGWAGLMRRIEEDPNLAPHESRAMLTDGLPRRAADDGPRGRAHGRR